MARKPRQSSLPLNEQLQIVSNEITKTQQVLKELELKKSDIEQQIEYKNMRDAYELLKQNNITVDQLADMLNSNEAKKVS